jgi:hypothetical protein
MVFLKTDTGLLYQGVPLGSLSVEIIATDGKVLSLALKIHRSEQYESQ